MNLNLDMSLGKDDLLSDYELAPRASNNCFKRSFSPTEDDINKRKRVDNQSQEDMDKLNLASDGYMTRNKLKKKLAENGEFDRSVTMKKSFQNDKSKNVGKRIRKSKPKQNKRKLQFGYIFTHDISSPYHGKQFTKNSTPSLFESDSELEYDCFQINDVTKNDVQVASIPKLEKIYKNGEVKTYFNKKLHKSISSYPNECENKKKLLSNSVLNIFSYGSQNCNDINICKEKIKVEKLDDISLKVSDPITSNYIEETKTDDTIIVTEEFIKQLEKELKTENKVLKVPFNTQKNCSDTDIVNSNILNTEQHENIEVMSHTILDDTINRSNMCTEDTNVNDMYNTKCNSSSCHNYLFKKDMININELVESELLPFKTSNVLEDNIFSIFDLPEENPLEKSFTINENVNFHSDSKTSNNISKEIIETNEFGNSNLDQFNEIYPIDNNKFKKENNTCPNSKKQNYNLDTSSLVKSNQYCYNNTEDNKKRKSEISVIEINIDGVIESDNYNIKIENSTKKCKSTQLGFKCHCKVFCQFNNKKLTSKTKHFAFKNNYKDIRKQFLHQKNLEANILKMLIAKDKKDIKKEKIKQTNSNMINKTFKEYVDVIENGDIEDNKATIQKEIFVQTYNSNFNNEEYVNINEDNYVKLKLLNKPNCEETKNINLEKHITTKHNSINEKCINKNNDIEITNLSTYFSMEKKDINQLEEVIQTTNSDSFKKCTNIKENDHIELSISHKPISKIEKNIQSKTFIPTKNSNLTSKTYDEFVIINEKNDHISNKPNCEETKNINLEKHITTKHNSINEKCINKNNDIEVTNLSTYFSMEKKDINQLEEVIQIKNSDSFKKCTNIKENDHIELSISHKPVFKIEKNMQSETFLPTENSNLTNKTYEEFVIINDNDHILHKPNYKEINNIHLKKHLSTHISEKKKNVQLEEDIPTKNFIGNTYEESVINDNEHILNKHNHKEIKNNHLEKHITTHHNLINENCINKNNDTEIRNLSVHVSEEKDTQLKEVIPTKNSNLINKKLEKCVNINESDHIEPNILSMLKDVYVDIEYLPEYCDYKKYDDKSPKLQHNKNVKIQVQASRNKLVENKCFTKSDNVISNITTNKLNSGVDVYLNEKNINETCLSKIKNRKSNLQVEINPFNISQSNNNTILITEVDNFNEKYEKCKNSQNVAENSLLFNSTKCYLESTEIKINDISKNEKPSVPASLEIETNKNVFELPKPPHYRGSLDPGNAAFISEEDKKLQDYAMPLHIAKQQNECLFNNHIEDSLNNIGSDDDDDDDDDNNRLLIEEDENDFDNDVHKNVTFIQTSTDNSMEKHTITADKLPLVKNIADCTSDKFYENKFNLHSKCKQLTEISIDNYDIVLNPEKELDLYNNKNENIYMVKEEKSSLKECMVMSFEMCDQFYEKRSLNKNIIDNKNEYFSKNISDIFTDMYVDEVFVSVCQHMIEFCDNVQLKNDCIFLQIDSKDINMISEKKMVCDINIDGNKVCSDVDQSVPVNTETVFETEIDYRNQGINKLSKYNIKTNNSLQKPKKIKSNYKIRIDIREFINSDKTMNDILESKEFRNLRYINEEEIACTIGVFLFEQASDPPIINGLLAYRENYEQLNDEEKNKLLSSTNLNISFPKIMKLTSVTLALVKMLRSDTLIDLILNVIRKNLFNKKMNTHHSVDQQLITQTVYFVDICIRLRLLKTLQTFIFDSMVLLPNKYCCVIFTSLLLWKNCLPVRMNEKQDPVIITAMSYLIAKKKFYAEQTVGCDIFQRELINLLSCHFNYSFSTDLPINIIQHIHKPDFFISVIMILKCCNAKDLVEFVVNCLFPIIEDYLNTRQNETNAYKIMESINMSISPFKISCNATVATYLKKCKSSIDNSIKDEKEHFYHNAYNSYKSLLNKFVEYFNDSRPRSQLFEELLVSTIMILGSVDYLTSCMTLLKWKPKFQLSTILTKKLNIFKSVLGHNIWDKLCNIDDINTTKCLVNSYLLKKDVYNTIIKLHAIH